MGHLLGCAVRNVRVLGGPVSNTINLKKDLKCVNAEK